MALKRRDRPNPHWRKKDLTFVKLLLFNTVCPVIKENAVLIILSLWSPLVILFLIPCILLGKSFLFFIVSLLYIFINEMFSFNSSVLNTHYGLFVLYKGGLTRYFSPNLNKGEVLLLSRRSWTKKACELSFLTRI